MSTTTWLKVLIGVSALCWVALLPLYGVQPSIELLGPYSAVVAIVTALFLLFDAALWRFPIVRQVLSKKPYIGGTWKVRIISDHKSETTNLPTKLECFASIKQHYSSIWITLYTDESTSRSLNSVLQKSESGLFEIVSCYQSLPRQQVRDRSSIHYGTLLLDTIDESIMIMKGHYWTDRGTRGEIEFTDRVSGTSNSYESAAKAVRA